MSEPNGKLMKAEEVSSELKQILDEKKDKHPTSFFDIGKARQTIYSILMGFVLKYFIEHTYNSWEPITLLQGTIWWMYILLLTYFLINCFRFLFGLVDLSNMTDSEFAPTKEEWHITSSIKNTLKLFVINTGVFQLIIFSFLVFALFPSLESSATAVNAKSVSDNIQATFPKVFHTFIIWNFWLMLIDILCVLFYLILEQSEKVDDNEKDQSVFWLIAGTFELLLSGVGYVATNDSNNLNYSLIRFVLIGLLAFNVFEIIGGFKYIGFYWSKFMAKRAAKTNSQ